MGEIILYVELLIRCCCKDNSVARLIINTLIIIDAIEEFSIINVVYLECYLCRISTGAPMLSDNGKSLIGITGSIPGTGLSINAVIHRIRGIVH